MIAVLPDKLHTAVYSGLVETKALQSLVRWYDSDCEAIVLQGGTGSAKTRGAAWLFEFALHRAVVTFSGARRGPIWCDAPGLATIAPWSDQWRSVYDTASLIFVDDVGTEPSTGDGPARIGAALERGFNVASGRVVLTTNLGSDVFGRRFGERITSRLRQSMWVELNEPDYREPANAQLLKARRKWPSPRDLSPKERAAAKRAEEAQAAEDAEWERTAGERAAFAAKAQAELVEKMRDANAQQAAVEAVDNERREALRRQLEELRRVT
ncbi:MAG: hypothetical protein ACRCZP_19835 [Phycicoccus sp.]